jgi:hypothetical protein
MLAAKCVMTDFICQQGRLYGPNGNVCSDAGLCGFTCECWIQPGFGNPWPEYFDMSTRTDVYAVQLS